MTRRNKILLGALAAAVVALLIALCFVGNTFARYTTSQTESASVAISNWTISITDSEGVAVTDDSTVAVSGVKPLGKSYADNESEARVNDTLVFAGTLTNTGDVAGVVTATAAVASASDIVYYEETKGDAKTTTNDDRNSTYSGTVGNHITVNVYYGTSQETLSGDGTDKLADHTSLKSLENLTESEAPLLAAKNGTLYIYFDVLWTTDINTAEDTTYDGTDGDLFDTWMAECVKSFGVGVTFSIVQTERTA